MKFFFFIDLFSYLVPIIFIPIFLSSLGPGLYGEFYLLVICSALFTPILSMCYGQSLIKFYHENGYINTLSLLEFILITLIVLVFLQSVNYFFISSVYYYNLFFCSTIVAFFTSYVVLLKDLLLHSSYKLLSSLLNLSCVLLINLTSYLLLKYDFDYQFIWQLRFYSELTIYSIALLMSYKTYKLIDIKNNLNSDNFSIKKYLKSIRFSFNFVPRVLLRSYLQFIERNYLILFFSGFILTAYTISYQVATVMIMPVIILSSFLSPDIIKSLKLKKLKLITSFTSTCIFYVSILFLVSFYLMDIFIFLNLDFYLDLEEYEVKNVAKILPFHIITTFFVFYSVYLLNMFSYASLYSSNLIVNIFFYIIPLIISLLWFFFGLE